MIKIIKNTLRWLWWFIRGPKKIDMGKSTHIRGFQLYQERNDVTGDMRHMSATYNDSIVRAVVEASHIEDHRWFLNRILVSPASERSKGLGGSLLDRLKLALMAADPQAILIVTPGGYSDDLKGQERFYKRHDFHPEKGFGGAWVWRASCEICKAPFGAPCDAGLHG